MKIDQPKCTMTLLFVSHYSYTVNHCVTKNNEKQLHDDHSTNTITCQLFFERCFFLAFALSRRKGKSPIPTMPSLVKKACTRLRPGLPQKGQNTLELSLHTLRLMARLLPHR